MSDDEDPELAAMTRAALEKETPGLDDPELAAMLGPLETLCDPIDDPELAAMTRAALASETPEVAPDATAGHAVRVDVSPDIAAAAVLAQLAPPVDFDLPPDFDQLLAADEQLHDRDLVGPVDDLFFLTDYIYPFGPYN